MAPPRKTQPVSKQVKQLSKDFVLYKGQVQLSYKKLKDTSPDAARSNATRTRA